MSGFDSHSLLRALLTGVAVSMSFGVIEAQRPDSVERAQALVESLYSDLKGKNLTAEVTVAAEFDQPWRLANPLSLVIRERANPSAPLLKAHVRFAGSDIEYARFEGLLIPSTALERVTARLSKGPNWNEDELRAALVAEKAVYGPDSQHAVVELVELDKWSQVFGRLSLRDVRFVWRLPFDDVAAKDRVVPPAWLVVLQAIGTDGDSRCYRIFLEPIGGRPTSVHGSSCQ